MQIRLDQSLQEHNTLALPARARALVEASSSEEIIEALDWAQAEGLAVVPWGEGSNVVLAGDLDALVLKQGSRGLQVLAETDRDVRLRVGAGNNWHTLVEHCLAAGYHGLENLALIPGAVGAAPVQNIGAYGTELDRFVECVHAIDIATGEALHLQRDDCRFAYRDSIFKAELKGRVIITALDLRLAKTAMVEYSYPTLAERLEAMAVSEPGPQEIFDAVVAVRRERLPDPNEEPNAGSFFKNLILPYEQAAYARRSFVDMPCHNMADGRVKIPAAWLIERRGWKGKRRGNVGVHPGHALVLVHYGGASGTELLDLAEEVREDVRQLIHRRLEIEPRVLGGT
ncbi:MAG: UDP-N-acetylmuramate dehydrogenase [Pseudomonadota bacterium]